MTFKVAISPGRAVLPVAIFVATMALHVLWHALLAGQDPAQSRWIAQGISRGSWLRRYIEAGDHWLGLSYGLSLAFATVALRRYRQSRLCTARNLAIGGVTFSGVLSVVGCYLIGCCGSPMLAVYLSLFGVAFIPLAKPLVAGMTVLFIMLGWWWMNRCAGRAAVGQSRGCSAA